MATKEQQQEWHKAQSLSISVDLITAARIQLEFLAQVHANPRLFTPPVLERAIERYERCWLPLANTDADVIPPLDCAWIWHCHRLNPIQYAEDCKQLFGKIIDAPLLEMTDSAFKTSMDTWAANFPDEPYSLDLYGGDLTRRYSNRPRNITYNLQDALMRQKDFYYQVSEPHYRERSFLEAAVKRYKGFLHLIKEHRSTFCVPTYDIDLMWHAHQLRSQSYRLDTEQAFGRILEHDDTDNSRAAGGKLDNGFTETRTLWQQAFGFPYEKEGCMYRGKPVEPLPQPALFDHAKLGTLSAHHEQRHHLKSREISKVHLSVRGVTGVSDDATISLVLKLMSNMKSFKLQTGKTRVSSSWNLVSEFETELSTDGLVLELHWVMGLKKLGTLVIPWREVINMDMQTLGGWLWLEGTQSGAAVSLLLFISMTPPVNGPYLLRSVRARDTGDDMATHSGHSKGMWVTRTVYDHSNEEAYVIRYRYKQEGFWGAKLVPDTEKVVHVHSGGWNYYRSHDDGVITGKVLGSAVQLVNSLVPLEVSRTWSLLNGSVILTVHRNVTDKKWNLRPQFTVETKGDCPIVLVSGRKLQFTVPGASETQEAGFVTMVRYTKDAPEGKATALFNWRSGGMQINQEEDVLVVLLIATSIGISVSDMMGRDIPGRTRSVKRRNTEEMDHFGAVRRRGGAQGGGRNVKPATGPNWLLCLCLCSLSALTEEGDDGDANVDDGGNDSGDIDACGDSWWDEAGNCQEANCGASVCGGGGGGGCGASTGGGCGVGGGGGSGGCGASGGGGGGCGGGGGGGGGCGT